MAKPLSILFVTSEIYPFIKTSEFADLCYAHCLGVREVGHDIRAMMPKYGYISERKNRIHEINRLRDIPIPVGNEAHPATVKSSSINNPRVKVQSYITTNSNYLDVNKGIEADINTGVTFPNNDDRFIFYSRTVLETCLLLGWFPDIIHCIGWQTALIPAYIRTRYPQEFKKTKIVMTISDFNEQGVFPVKSLLKTGLTEEGMAPGRYKSKMNFLRIGLSFADRVTTLSPTYAKELTANKEFKENWLPLLHKKPLVGIGHGIDLLHWNPKTDTNFKTKYDVTDLSNKDSAREALQKSSGLTVNSETMVAAFIGPLTEDRGADAFIAAIPELVQLGLQVVIATDLPTPLRKSADALMKKNPHQVHVRVGYDEEYLHHLMAGATILVKPSRHEISGQFQRIALAYGTIPVIRNVGGIAEEMTDVDEVKGSGNSFIIKKTDAADIVKTVKRAQKVHASHEAWSRIVGNAMSTPVSWVPSAQGYDEFYRNLVKETK
ncbi:MAG: glycogen/starch synthase [Candidatus Kapabacteria bacterium]|nr:glycogen/starch synthase [Candidatus Kapabacteria bacterium]